MCCRWLDEEVFEGRAGLLNRQSRQLPRGPATLEGPEALTFVLSFAGGSDKNQKRREKELFFLVFLPGSSKRLRSFLAKEETPSQIYSHPNLTETTTRISFFRCRFATIILQQRSEENMVRLFKYHSSILLVRLEAEQESLLINLEEDLAEVFGAESKKISIKRR
ncbi:hypothetical protein AVEN_185945-1 [Araneus ventricosus]|uniref:Uncharacterized protein n=1 Tax=Araneus ventricosus TaxID=182803 RepID=A0A4Y2JCI5_ARAVE|nr:hypothetical protein AVEN_185945-1 [Araneus ventricosus]